MPLCPSLPPSLPLSLSLGIIRRQDDGQQASSFYTTRVAFSYHSFYPCMWFLSSLIEKDFYLIGRLSAVLFGLRRMGGYFHEPETVVGWIIRIWYSRAVERRCLASANRPPPSPPYAFRPVDLPSFPKHFSLLRGRRMDCGGRTLAHSLPPCVVDCPPNSNKTSWLS